MRHFIVFSAAAAFWASIGLAPAEAATRSATLSVSAVVIDRCVMHPAQPGNPTIDCGHTDVPHDVSRPSASQPYFSIRF
jgi:hypothetical protein